jgi:hypothetical protein
MQGHTPPASPQDSFSSVTGVGQPPGSETHQRRSWSHGGIGRFIPLQLPRAVIAPQPDLPPVADVEKSAGGLVAT